MREGATERSGASHSTHRARTRSVRRRDRPPRLGLSGRLTGTSTPYDTAEENRDQPRTPERGRLQRRRPGLRDRPWHMRVPLMTRAHRALATAAVAAVALVVVAPLPSSAAVAAPGPSCQVDPQCDEFRPVFYQDFV